MTLWPVDKDWIYTYIFEPVFEGIERVTRAWHGINFHHIDYPTLSLKKRVISWLIGTILLIPLINTVIWLYWQTFGNPEYLSAHQKVLVSHLF